MPYTGYNGQSASNAVTLKALINQSVFTCRRGKRLTLI